MKSVSFKLLSGGSCASVLGGYEVALGNAGGVVGIFRPPVESESETAQKTAPGALDDLAARRPDV
jgi:hypothetical protein